MSSGIRRVIPPAANPLSLRSWGKAFGGSVDATSRFRTELMTRLDVRSCLLVSSGRAALTLGLRALAERAPTKRVVVIPAYCCYTVPASVSRAALSLRVSDVDPDTLDLDLESLRSVLREDVLAVVVPSAYGLCARVAEVSRLAAAVGAAVVDDAAQGFGGTSPEGPCGSQGIFGIMSFSKGKGLSTFEGGALLSDDPALVERAATFVARDPGLRSTEIAIKALGFALFQRPELYAVVHRLPFLGLGQSVFDDQFTIEVLTSYQAGLGLEALRGADALVRGRRLRADNYRRMLADHDHVRVPAIAHGTAPAWTRFPVLVDARRRSALLEAFEERGLGVSPSYPQSLPDVPEVSVRLDAVSPACPGARRIAESILTLPTHPYVTEDDQQAIVALMSTGTMKAGLAR